MFFNIYFTVLLVIGTHGLSSEVLVSLTRKADIFCDMERTVNPVVIFVLVPKGTA